MTKVFLNQEARTEDNGDQENQLGDCKAMRVVSPPTEPEDPLAAALKTADCPDKKESVLHLLEQAVPIKYHPYRSARLQEAMYHTGYGRYDRVDRLERKWCRALGKGVDNHVVVEIISGGRNYAVRFSDWGITIGEGCVRENW